MTTAETISVLVIDDDEVAREFLCDVLRRADFVVEDSASTIGVTNKIVRDRFHVVVLDIMMPTIRGDKLAALLHKNSHLRTLGVVMVSGAPVTELVELVGESAARAVVSKADARRLLPEAVMRAARARPPANL
jgi:CheY-like chemotaxis protein